MRNDMTKRLKKVFMQFQEIENCKFEPATGALSKHWAKFARNTKEPRFKQETVPGDFFDRMGENFCKSNPALYKQGKLKKAMTNWRNGDANKALLILCEGFDLTKVFMHYRSE